MCNVVLSTTSMVLCSSNKVFMQINLALRSFLNVKAMAFKTDFLFINVFLSNFLEVLILHKYIDAQILIKIDFTV